MDFEDFKDIFGYWSVNKYIYRARFHYQMMQSKIKSPQAFYERYQNSEFFLTRIEVKEAGMHTFAVSQFGSRLLPRRSNYKYANCIAYLVKANQKGDLAPCSFVAKNITRQDRDTYLECNIQP